VACLPFSELTGLAQTLQSLEFYETNAIKRGKSVVLLANRAKYGKDAGAHNPFFDPGTSPSLQAGCFQRLGRLGAKVPGDLESHRKD